MNLENDISSRSFSGKLDDDLAMLRSLLKLDESIIYRRFENKKAGVRGCMILVEGLVDSLLIDQNIVRPLLTCQADGGHISAESLAASVISTDEIKIKEKYSDAINSLYVGDTVILIDGSTSAIIANSKKYSLRSVGAPETENAVNGPKEGFTELIVTNISLIRRKVKNPNLKFRFFEIGKVSRTRTCLAYIEGIAGEKAVSEMIRRLSAFEIDSVLDVNYLSELISDSPTSLFSTMGKTERPDVVAAKLFEGRIALLCDGTPYALTAPFLFLENFQASEDYYENFYFASFKRILRFLSFFIAVSLPALYIALISYHKEMIPRSLLISIARSRASVPFPAALEMLLLLMLFDLLRESGVRLPKAIGVTVSTVGAIVLGQSIVSANIVSAEMIIIVAICGIASYLTPKLEAEIVILRVSFLILASFLGVYGYAIATAALTALLSSLSSFGVAFTSYIIPKSAEGAKDGYFRALREYMKKRPRAIAQKNLTRFRRRY